MSIEAKKALRKSTKSRLSGLSEDEVSAQSREAQHLVLGLREYRDATNISVYLSMPKAEAQTDLLVHEALKAGKKVFVPYIHRPKLHEDGAKRRSIIEMLRLGSIEEYEGLERDSWGIPSLSPDGLEARENAMGGNGLGSANVGDEHGLELIVVPGVAFDSGMNRLGHGAGFYDEYLKRYCAGRHRKKPYLVGLCLAEQYLEDKGSIPTNEHDWRMDIVAIGDGRLATSKTYKHHQAGAV